MTATSEMANKKRRAADATPLVLFMLASARNLVDETPRYGPLRLVQACKRLIAFLEESGISPSELDGIVQALTETEPLIMTDEERFVEALDTLILQLTPSIGKGKNQEAAPKRR